MFLSYVTLDKELDPKTCKIMDNKKSTKIIKSVKILQMNITIVKVKMDDMNKLSTFEMRPWPANVPITTNGS